jgi:hypothetical protein
MPKVLPSQAVAAIDRLFPFLANAGADPGIGANDAPSIAAVVALLDQIPAELITLEGGSTAAWSKNALE